MRRRVRGWVNLRRSFHLGYQQDTITGFAAHSAGGTDIIDLNGYGLTFASLGGFMSQNGANTVIDILNGDILTLINIQKANLQASDFHF